MLCFAGCAAPTSALLGPTITGAATDSLARASLSYTSNIMMTNLKQSFFDKKYVWSDLLYDKMLFGPKNTFSKK